MARWVFTALIVISVCFQANAEFGEAERAYSNGDIDGALFEFEKRAKAGDGEALYTLGVIHARGVDVPRDFAEAYKWMCLASMMGTKDAARRAAILTRPLSHKQLLKAEARAAEWLEDNPLGRTFEPCYTPG